ncbi:hypothetical protein EVAR_20970_1 [Eumeta japonica]|uniref:Uncharacterized protein n=1 Tax=Eumeta variegata TaxID=151549 RepID=A0A4C1V5I5_EUMVA|nr:hypothetical protein EVAR_20970_1 [Eumeta japonica]
MRRRSPLRASDDGVCRESKGNVLLSARICTLRKRASQYKRLRLDAASLLGRRMSSEQLWLEVGATRKECCKAMTCAIQRSTM